MLEASSIGHEARSREVLNSSVMVRYSWKRAEISPRPYCLAVVCYTNHLADGFVREFHESVLKEG